MKTPQRLFLTLTSFSILAAVTAHLTLLLNDSLAPSIVWLVSLLAVSLVASLVVRGALKRLAHLKSLAEEVTAGRTPSSLQSDDSDEIGDLSNAIERMRREMAGRIDRAHEDRRLLAAIIAGMREGILVLDAEKRLLLMNDSMKQTLSVVDDVGEGTPVSQILWERSVLESYDEALAANQAVRQRVTIYGGRSYELTVTPFSDRSGGPSGAIGLFFDVTRLHALEQVRREFVADISHELRTPLASVRAAVETLQSGLGLDETRRFLTMIVKNTSRMETILQDLSALSRIETGSIKLSRTKIDLLASINDVASSLKAQTAARRVEIKVQVPPGMTLWADRRRLDQILLNVLENAVKFNREGGSVIVTAGSANGMVVLSVEDTGPGIPPDSLERIFNRFYRVDRARSKEVPGTGLGLAIVKHLVRLHGGRVRAENRETMGTRIVLELPVNLAPTE